MEYQTQVSGYSPNAGSNWASFESGVENTAHTVGTGAVDFVSGVGRGTENIARTVGTGAVDFVSGVGHGVEDVAGGIGNVAGVIGQDIERGVQYIGRGVGSFADTAYSDIRSVGWKDLYASDPGNVALRDAMQDPSILNTFDYIGRNDHNIFGLQNRSVNVIPADTTTVVVPRNTQIIDYNSLVFVIILLLLFVLWRYWTKK